MAILASQELIRAIRSYKAGDQQAFEDIYSGSIQYVTRCVLTVLNRTAPGASEDLRQDIIQDTYLTIATKLDTLQSEEAFLQWAGQIATNHALRTWEKDVRRQEREQSEDDMLYELPDERFIPEDILYNLEKQQMIRKMLQELPTSQYLCLVEYFYNGLKETEVAQKLGMPLGTVKTNLSRAKKKLKDIVQTHEKKTGVKLYSMSWLLLLLWKAIRIPAPTPAQTQAAVRAVMAQLPKAAGAAVAGASGSASAAGTAGTSGSASAAGVGSAATGAAAKAAIPLAAKIAAVVLAAATAIGGVTAVISGSKEPAPMVETGPAPIVGEYGPESMHYNGHYYNLVGPFEDWNQVQEYRDKFGGYPMSVGSEEENWILSEFLWETVVSYEENGEWYSTEVQYPVYIGFYWDREENQWKWASGEDVVYTNWLEAPKEIPDAGQFVAYCPARNDIQWRTDAFGDDESQKYWVLWEYEEDSTPEQRGGPEYEWWLGRQSNPETIKEYPEDAFFYEFHVNGWWDETENVITEPEITAARCSDVICYDGHYYAIMGTFLTWDEVMEYTQVCGGYPVTISSAEENAAVHTIVSGNEQIYTGLYWDEGNDQWQWVNGEPVGFTYWTTEEWPEETHGECRVMSYRYPIYVNIGAVESVWVDGRFPREDGFGEVVFEFETLPEFFEGVQITEIIPENEFGSVPADVHLVPIMDADKVRMEQVLRYVAYVDCDFAHSYVGQGRDEYQASVEAHRYDFLDVTQPAADMWDRCEVLLLMGWNQDPALGCGVTSSFSGDTWGGGIYYSESKADAVITNLLGDMDTSLLQWNIVSQGYNTEISSGYIYQPATHLFNEDYGSLTVEYIEDLGEGKVAIHAKYEREFTLECVYTAQKNPDSIIGYTLTDVSYGFAE